VEKIALPRHFIIEEKQNRATSLWLREVFESSGCRVITEGPHANIVALPQEAPKEAILVGAHYDTVPESPGADDNGSAVAALIGCACACALWQPALPIIFVAFNREEEHLKGSREFVESWLSQAGISIRCAHILEMIGYASNEPGTQKVPTGLPIRIPTTGNFLGLLANERSAPMMDSVMHSACTYVRELPVIGLQVQLGLEKLLPVLGRSDHVPFWEKDLTALMWTDTAEFRNPNYHTQRDLPATLNYTFLLRVTRLLVAAVIIQARELSRPQ
jgi:Zn-dependent M28 family amino/carboxypeptidase